MSDKINKYMTLGDKLKTQGSGQPVWFSWALFTLPIIGLLSWWASESLILGLGAVSLSALYLILVFFDKSKRKGHFLISGDQQGFIKSLKLSDKTAIFDGSNIYHFGLNHGVGKKALATLIKELRSDGFRLVCFFDANIYFTLLKNGEFQKNNGKFSITTLQRIFSLREIEIYIVPSGYQADKYIIESLSLLPISFAVTNDRYRDYEAEYDFLTEDKQWQKGVTIKSGKLLLYQYSFKQPLNM